MTWLFLGAAALLFLAPLVLLFLQVRPDTLSEILAAPSFPKVIGVTLASGMAGAALSVLLGFVIARQFALYDWRGKRPQRICLLLPYLVPNFVLATAYVVAWNPGTGLLNNLIPLPFELYGLAGMTLAFAIAHLPVAFLMLEDKLRRLDPALSEAARLGGATSRHVAWRIELPLLRPTLISAFGLCLALDVSAFAIPAWIGAPARSYPLTYKIYQAIQVGGQDGMPQAAVYSLVLFLMILPVLFLSARAQRHERRYAVVTGKASRTAGKRQARSTHALFQVLFWILLISCVMAPMLCLFAQTLTLPGCLQQNGLACAKDLTLRSYKYVLFDLSETKLAFIGSTVYGSLSALLVMIVALLALVFLMRARTALRIAEWIFTVLTATPGAVIALGLIVGLSGRFGINLYNTPWIVVVAFVLKHENLAFQPLRTGISNLSPQLLEAARLAGASQRQLWTRIVVPLLRPECIGAFFLVLVPILGELTMSIFLASPSYRSIGTVLFDLQDYADHASAGALSMILIVLILIANELGRLLSRGRLGY